MTKARMNRATGLPGISFGVALLLYSLATWLAVHPNVPSRHMRRRAAYSFACTVLSTCTGYHCPEVVILWAFRARLVASALSKRLSRPSILFSQFGLNILRLEAVNDTTDILSAWVDL